MSWLQRWKRRRKLASVFRTSEESARQSPELSPDEVVIICSSLSKLKNENYTVERFWAFSERLDELWNPVEVKAQSMAFMPAAQTPITEPENNQSLYSDAPAISVPEESPVLMASRPSDTRWFIAMPREFIKSIEKIDRKLQGRILEAIAEICQNPVTVRGDTVKPLANELRGLWRYRLGDYRLIYQPVFDMQQVILIRFDDRGSVYG